MIELKNEKILLLGLGLHGGGVATACWLYKHGAKLIVSDLRSPNILKPSLAKLKYCRGIRFVLGKHREQDVRWADIVVQNPGVAKESPYIKLAKKLGKPVVNEATLFFDHCPCPIIGVTGTRGKSTTASWIAALLGTVNKKTVLAGNIRTQAMLEVVDKLTPKNLVVLELSSWQLEGLAAVKKAPHVAVVTNLYPDHLNRYRSLADYYRSKKEIFRFQTKNDFLVLNGSQPQLRSWAKQAKGAVLFFNAKNNTPGAQNAAAASAVARLYKVKAAAIKKFLQSPPGLPGRQEIVAQKRGVTFVNDTTATTPVACLAALRRFGSSQGRILLLAGGADKGLDYKDWGQGVKKYCHEVWLLKGNASDKMARALPGFKNIHLNYTNLGGAVREAFDLSVKGDIILLSPGAASFNLWNHEFERGEEFEKSVRRL